MKTQGICVVLFVSLSAGCVPGPEGPPGPQGQMGVPGKDAMIAMGAGPPTCNEQSQGALYVNTSTMMPRLEYCDGSKWGPLNSPSHPDCPIGYVRDAGAANIVLCKRGSDEVVRVGSGGAAFWIDRYEASVWERSDASGKQYGTASADYPPGFPKNGQATTALYAASKADVVPTRFLTWFQASEACRASGKRLAHGDEWLAAARGTVDPGDSDGTGGACITAGPSGRRTGLGTRCVSDWGAQDMIGNFWEMTADWIATVGNIAGPKYPWPDASYNNASTYGISSAPGTAEGTTAQGAPSMVARGGGRGIFSMDVGNAPSNSYGATGFRCVVPR